MTERRRDQRYPRGDLSLTLTDGVRAQSIDISSRGLNCLADKPIPEFSKLKVSMHLPLSDGDRYTVECEGVVVRCEPLRAKGKLHYNLAVYFLNLDNERASFIEELLASEKNQSGVECRTGDRTIAD